MRENEQAHSDVCIQQIVPGNVSPQATLSDILKEIRRVFSAMSDFGEMRLRDLNYSMISFSFLFQIKSTRKREQADSAIRDTVRYEYTVYFLESIIPPQP